MITSDIKVELIDWMGSDLSVVNAARVSFDKQSMFVCKDACDSFLCSSDCEQVLAQADRKLINYLAKHKHYSPFNHAFASFRVKAPIFVARQLVKHKFLPWNEVSRRYVDSEPEFYVPSLWRKRAISVKQGSEGALVDQGSQQDIGGMAAGFALSTYETLLKNGVCPEQARMVLPQNTMTEWIWSGSLGAFAAMCKLRLDPHTQAETRIVAEVVARELEELYPVSFVALLEN